MQALIRRGLRILVDAVRVILRSVTVFRRKIQTLIRSGARHLVSTLEVRLGSLTVSRIETILTFGRLVGFLAFGFAVMLLLWNQFVRFDHRNSDPSNDVLLLASYPRYLPTDDEGGIVVTVVNTGQRPITGTAVSLVCGNTEYISVDVDGTSRVYFGSLQPNERKTKLLKFQVGRVSSVVQRVQIVLELTVRSRPSVAAALKLEPIVFSFLPLGVSSLVLNRTFIIPNLVVAIAAIVALLKSGGETIKVFREVRGLSSRK